ncbi:MAG: histidinol dehydrogenase, partial [Porticoccaceae bacterium]|nr:histidinol dehydrogenase [Porticoccaceae bacterium]
MTDLNLQIHLWNQLDDARQRQLLARPALANATTLASSVRDIIQRVRNEGDAALKALSAQFDKVEPGQLLVDSDAVEAAAQRLDDRVKQALQQAAANIRRFHEAQRP